MKQAIALLACGIAALVLQGAAATVVPPPWCPDLALLVVIAVGVCREGLATGSLIAVSIGYASDVVSGSLLGQHAFLRLLVFAGARLGSRQLNLRGAIPLAVFAASSTLVYGLVLAALTAFIADGSLGSWAGIGDFALHAIVNGLAAPIVVGLVMRVAAWTAGDDAARRALRLDARATAS